MPPASAWSAWLLLAAAAVVACAPQRALEPSALRSGPPAAAPPKPRPPKEGLLAALRGIERPAPVLELLSRPSLAVLDSRLQSLSPEQREQLLTGDLVEAMPLLHLRAGGGSGRALLSLATSPVASHELPLAFELLGQVTDEDRLRPVRLAQELARRSALHFLRDRVLDVANAPPAELPGLLAVVERAAIAAERPDVVRLTLEAWAAAGANAEVMARLGAACAYARDQKCVSQVLSGSSQQAAEHQRLVQLNQALEALNDGDPLVKAWGLLRIGRYAEAREAFVPLSVHAKTDLRVAAGVAVAIAEGNACPGLAPQVGSPRSCADAFRARPGLAAALADLNEAWSSGSGRDADAVEAYIGLSHVVPWVAELALPAVDAAQLERSFAARHRALSGVLAELPAQKPLSVFASALAAGVSAGLRAQPGERPRLEAEQREELWFAALGVEPAAPRLAVSALLSADQPVLPLLPRAAPEPLVPALAGLAAWEAASSTEPATLAMARGALADQVATAPKGTTEGAAAVLLLAELNAASAPSEATYSALAQVAGQLIGQPLPPELALRAVLDAAGALERMGKPADALGILSKASEIASLPGQAADLLTLIRAERLVLEWSQGKDPERKELAKALQQLDRGEAPATIAFVLGAYGNSKAARQPRQSAPAKATLSERIGVRASESMAKGTLRATRVSLRLAYDFQTGVTPEVTFEPMLVPLVRPDLIQRAL
jgi:hypothetical protein